MAKNKKQKKREYISSLATENAAKGELFQIRESVKWITIMAMAASVFTAIAGIVKMCTGHAFSGIMLILFGVFVFYGSCESRIALGLSNPTDAVKSAVKKAKDKKSESDEDEEEEEWAERPDRKPVEKTENNGNAEKSEDSAPDSEEAK